MTKKRGWASSQSVGSSLEDYYQVTDLCLWQLHPLTQHIQRRTEVADDRNGLIGFLGHSVAYCDGVVPPDYLAEVA